METFGFNSAKSYIGKNVNLHLKDGSVIINVHLISVKKANLGKTNLIEYIIASEHKLTTLPLGNIAWAEMLNPNLIRIDN